MCFWEKKLKYFLLTIISIITSTKQFVSRAVSSYPNTYVLTVTLAIPSLVALSFTLTLLKLSFGDKTRSEMQISATMGKKSSDA